MIENRVKRSSTGRTWASLAVAMGATAFLGAAAFAAPAGASAAGSVAPKQSTVEAASVVQSPSWPEYQQGEMGWNIAVAKHLLAEEGSLQPGEVLDDRFDDVTVEALLDYQQATDLAVTGVLDVRSWDFLAQEAGTVSQGDESHAVTAVQIALAEKLGYDLSDDGYQTYSPDQGTFGAATHAAVVDFQEQAGIDADGRVDPGTLQSLVNTHVPENESPGH